MQIKDVSINTGLSIHTIRFYEKIGLLDSNTIKRTRNNYRQYDESVFDTIKAIKYAKDIGFTLKEIEVFLSNVGIRKINDNERIEILRTKQMELQMDIKKINKVVELIRDKIIKLENRNENENLG
jgi:DNA-binding transcriptional MerR regulator